ncbi:MAG: hypothetical protein AB1635_08980 [Acidobacteriota bacterium]
MDEQTGVESCRWARPTVRLPYPQWLESEQKPWTCLRDAQPNSLEDTDICHDCPRWESRRLDVSRD